MIAVVDYDAGNLRSVANALERLGADYVITSEPEAIRQADRVILPGVGEAASAMRSLSEKGLAQIIPGLRQPVLGICIGMQLMCRRSEEGDAACLGIFQTDVRRLEGGPGLKIPHMGWDTIENLRSPLFEDVPEGEYLYYVHSYAAGVCPQTVAVTSYGGDFSAALCERNFYGVQFHPEKSGAAGQRILKNFLSL